MYTHNQNIRQVQHYAASTTSFITTTFKSATTNATRSIERLPLRVLIICRSIDLWRKMMDSNQNQY